MIVTFLYFNRLESWLHLLLEMEDSKICWIKFFQRMVRFMSAHLFCAQQWMSLRQCDKVFVTKREIHACLPVHSLLWPVIQCVSDNLAKQFHTAYHNTFRSWTLCSNVKCAQPRFVVVIHGMTVEKIPSFLVSTAAEAFGVIGVCLADSGGNGTFWPTIYPDVSGSSL